MFASLKHRAINVMIGKKATQLKANIIMYCFLFVSLYFEVFLVITYLENRSKIKQEELLLAPKVFPTVTIIVPCFNEEKTVEKTVETLLSLNYPKELAHSQSDWWFV